MSSLSTVVRALAEFEASVEEPDAKSTSGMLSVTLCPERLVVTVTPDLVLVTVSPAMAFTVTFTCARLRAVTRCPARFLPVATATLVNPAPTSLSTQL